MNLISDLESDLAYAVLIEKKHTEKIGSQDVLLLIKRLNEALASISAKNEKTKYAAFVNKTTSSLSH